MNLYEWKKKHSARRNLAHFDDKVSLNQVWKYISSPQKIATHGFYPFIHYTLSFRRYDKLSLSKYKVKKREIFYSAHIDRYIYQYYGYKLNGYYNRRVEDDGINNAVIAYRDNLHKNNIHFAKIAIDFIKNQKECYVIIGDFTNFFDNLDHKYLKKMLCSLMNTEKLPSDYYAVYKNITKYSLWHRNDLLTLNGLENKRTDIHEFNKLDRALSLEQFKYLKKKYIQSNKNNYGIPQGSAISAVFSNIYMLNFDKEINDYVNRYSGLYMRYSDDFIIVLPTQNINEFREQFKHVHSLIKSIPNVKLEPEKTQLFIYTQNKIRSCNEDILQDVKNSKNFMNYLGFTFDGESVSIRAKTVSKYYHKLNRKLKTIVKSKGITKKKNRISCHNVYEKYSIKGALGRKSQDGNFITYVLKAESIFKNEKSISIIRKRHMQQIRKKIKKAKIK